MNTNIAIQYLTTNRLLHIDMLEAIHREKATLIYVEESGVLLRHTEDPIYMISTTSSSLLASMVDLIPNESMVVAHQRFSVEYITQRKGIKPFLECYQTAYFHTHPIIYEHPSVRILPLHIEHLEFVIQHYSHVDDTEYIADCLQSGLFFGAYIDNTLTGFMGVHGEGSLGMLEILPEYRRQGIAQALVTHMVNVFIDRGYIPFAQVKVDNYPSLELNRKLGFEISSEPIWWMM